MGLRGAVRASGAALLVAQTPEQLAAVGRQAGGRVAFFLYADRFDETYDVFRQKGVDFCDKPGNEAYGKVAVFKDLYSDKRDLLEKRSR